ncbi:hypothetical protein JVT61DRAFT_10983 [Boletus reticuloceps]|uniref:Uncharacterized protein n=1 Tax=Boletus reticuloceps TaxID=495285 RepID=A0A8I2YF46_9AGAM|nr:hypothetical protein JVT61DRAFT_10983 [Boletus reticuloceps]
MVCSSDSDLNPSPPHMSLILRHPLAFEGLRVFQLHGEQVFGFQAGKHATSHGGLKVPTQPPSIEQTESLIKIASVLMVSNSVNLKNALCKSKKPTMELQEDYRAARLFVTRDGNQVIGFYLSWNMSAIDSWLCCLLPKPFVWVDAHYGKPDPGSFHWVLLGPDQQKFFPLKRPTITGSDLNNVKGPRGKNYTFHSITVVPWGFILSSVYTNWDEAIMKALANQSVDPGSKLPVDSDDQVKIESDPIDDDTAPELPSKHTNTKGKGKASVATIEVIELSSGESNSGDSNIQILGTATTSTIPRLFDFSSSDFDNEKDDFFFTDLNTNAMTSSQSPLLILS